MTDRSPSRVAAALLTLLALVLAGPATPAAAQDVYDLRLQLEEGQSYQFTINNDMDMQQQVMGRQVDIETDQATTYRYDVTGVDEEGVMDITATYERVEVTQDGMGGGFSYDSADPDAEVPPGAQGVATLVGQTFQMRIAPDGEVVSVEGTGDIIDAMMEESDAPPAMRTQMQNQFGREGMQELMTLAFGYAREGVEVGQSWQTTSSVTRSFPMAVETTYTLDAVDGEMATLSVASEISTPEDAEPIPAGMGGEMELSMTGTQTGTARVDLATGLHRQSQTESEMSGTGEVRANGQAIPVEMTINSAVTYESAPVE